MSGDQIQVIPEHVRDAVLWEGKPEGRRDPVQTVPIELKDALLWFAEVMYCRFEFARCAYWEVMVPEPEHFRRLFPWTFERKTFFGSQGATTYLDDLRKDIKRADKKRQLGAEARAMLKYFTEITRCPLYNFEQNGVPFTAVTEDFFPDPDQAADRLREYCYQLIEVQTYLTKEIGVRPGALLPAWIQTEAKDVPALPEMMLTEEMLGIKRAPRLPVIGVLAEDTYIANVLTCFIAWEFGCECPVPKQPRRLRGNDFYCRALKWGRIAFHRYLQGLWAETLSVPGRDNVAFKYRSGDVREINRWLKANRAEHLGHVDAKQVSLLQGKATKNQKRKVRDVLPDSSWLKDYPLTTSDDMRKLLETYPKLGVLYKRNIQKPKNPQIILSQAKTVALRARQTTDLVSDPAFRKDAENAMKYGSELIHAAYKNLWRL